jgi:hypothetical protein
MPRKQTETGALCFDGVPPIKWAKPHATGIELSTVGAVDLRDIQRVSITDSELGLFIKVTAVLAAIAVLLCFYRCVRKDRVLATSLGV